MSAPAQVKQQAKEARQLEAQEAMADYARCVEDMNQFRADLRDHDAQRDKLEKVRNLASEKTKAAAAEVCRAQEARASAEAECAAAAAVAGHSERRETILRALSKEQDELHGRETVKDYKAGAAKAAKLSFEEALRSQQEPVAKPAHKAWVPFPSWTVGMIYSDNAKHWEPASNGWIAGYPHQADPACKQRFLLHFDSGNAAHTCITRNTFDFLGLGARSKQHGMATIAGLHGQSKHCPLYEIKFNVDLLKKAHSEPGHIFQRTVIAAVIETRSSPGVMAFFDLFVSAEDTRKLTNFTVNDNVFLF